MKLICIAVSIAVAAHALPAWAGPTADTAGTCLTDNTTGKDRKILTRWVYLAMSKHPELRALSSATSADHDASTRDVAALFQRLVVVDCRDEIKAMIAAEGSGSMGLPFEVLGRVAMLELMGNPDVAAEIARIDRFIDKTKVDAAVRAD